MIRTIFTFILLASLPFVFVSLMGRYKQRSAADIRKTARWEWVAIAALLVALMMLGITAIHDGNQAGSDYQPPRYENGHIVPPSMKVQP